MKTKILFCAATLLVALAAPDGARADVSFAGRGFIDSDVRMAVDSSRGPAGSSAGEFFWNRNMLEYEASIFSGDNIRGVAHARLMYFGLYKVEALQDLQNRTTLDPFRIDSDNLYLEWRGFATPDLDLRVGRMIRQWGSADLFNPTNNLNPWWLEDPMMFGRKLGNQMISLTYNFPIADLSIEGVVVPIFRPSMLPLSASNGLANPGLAPIPDDSLKEALVDELNRQEAAGGIVVRDPQVRLNMPAFDWKNVAYAARAKWRVADLVDMSLSYYYGRNSIPFAKRSFTYSGADVMVDGRTKTEQRTLVDMVYPRMHVVGFDLSTPLPFLFDVGFWAEMTVTVPERVDFQAYLPNYRDGDLCAVPGAASRDITVVCTRNTQQAFFKATAGFDYSWTSWLYMNVQYIHGFIDEFGHEAFLNDYVVGGLDFKFLDEALLLRTFAIVNLQDTSTVLYPSLSYKFLGVTLAGGSLIFVGDADSKFGQKATGRNQVYFKARFDF
jgi:hypothetical protein